MDQGPSKGLHDVSLMSHDRRLRGRPRLCSDCGLCDSFLRPRMAEICLFVRNRAEEIELRLHGRRRRPGDELPFGIYREMAVMRLRRPVPGAQWSGMVTTLAARLLERGEVEAVILAGTSPGTRFEPFPVLARGSSPPPAFPASTIRTPCPTSPSATWGRRLAGSGSWRAPPGVRSCWNCCGPSWRPGLPPRPATVPAACPASSRCWRGVPRVPLGWCGV